MFCRGRANDNRIFVTLIEYRVGEIDGLAVHVGCSCVLHVGSCMQFGSRFVMHVGSFMHGGFDFLW